MLKLGLIDAKTRFVRKLKPYLTRFLIYGCKKGRNQICQMLGAIMSHTKLDPLDIKIIPIVILKLDTSKF